MSMASSQIEIVMPSHFGFILKEQNHKDRCKDTTTPNANQNTQTTLQRNLKKFVRDQFQSCVSVTSESCNLMPNHNNNYYQHHWGNRQSSREKDEDGETFYPMYKRHSRILDQWATQQEAEDMIINTTDDERHTYDGLVEHTGRLSKSSCSGASCFIRDPSPTPSDNSSTDLSVSSLVQKWSGFEAESKNSNNQTNNSNNNNNINGKCLALNQYDNSEKMANVGPYNSGPRPTMTESIVTHENNNVESTMSQNQNQNQFQEQQLLRDEQVEIETSSSTLDGQEEERIRVADIVRKWAHSNQGSNECKSTLCPCPSLVRLKIGIDIRDQNGVWSPVFSSPKVRGRQAIADLFKRMERDRYKEVEVLRSRVPVSKFRQRGRIQSLLRLQFLRREACAQNDKERSLLRCTGGPIQSESSSNRSALRERYSTIKAQEMTTVKNYVMDVSSNDQDKCNAPASKETCEKNVFEKDLIIERRGENLMDYTTEKQCTSSPNNDDNIQILCQELMNERFKSPKDNNISHQSYCADKNELRCDSSGAEHAEGSGSPMDNENREDDNHCVQNQNDTNIPIQYNVWGEQQDEYIIDVEQDGDLKFIEANLDWTIDIARPRSYWEDRRQAWYQEILNTHSQDEEIRQLLERGNVSSVLASDFREKMDQLVMSSIHKVFSSNKIDEDIEIIRSIEDKDNEQSMIACKNVRALEHNQHYHQETPKQVQEHDFSVKLEQDDDKVDDNDDDVDNIDEDLTTCNKKYHHTSEDSDQSPSSPHFPWIRCPDQETGDDSDHAASTSVRKHSYYHETREGSSSKNISSLEMEFIFDLREHMQQLQSEMCELRKSITSCMNMQVKLQQSIIKGIPVSSNIKGVPLVEQKREKKSNIRNTKKNRCRICNEMAVDSLFYRCGHICTCFDCANNLQISSEKCPVCQAQIIDVVRICVDA